MPTITTDPKVLAARFNQAFNAHDEKTLNTLIAPNATFTAPGDIRSDGKEAVLAYVYGWLKAFPDAKLNVTRERCPAGRRSLLVLPVRGQLKATLDEFGDRARRRCAASPTTLFALGTIR